LLEDFDGVTVKIHSDADRKKSDEENENEINASGEFAIAPNEIGRFEANKANGGKDDNDDENDDDEDDDDGINRRYRIVQSGKHDGVDVLRAVYVRGGDTKKAFKNAEMITNRVHILRAGFKRPPQKIGVVEEGGEKEEDKIERKKAKTAKKTPTSTTKAKKTKKK